MSDEQNIPITELISPAERESRFIDSITEKIVEDVRQRMPSPSQYYLQEEIDEDIEKAVSREKAFCVAVIGAYNRWSQEQSPIVLWDVDQTLGHNEFPTPDVMEWRFRPSMFLLMDYLREEYPNVRNGILSDRTGIKTQLEDSSLLGPFSRYVDENFLYSSRDIDPSDEALMPFADNIVQPNNSHVQKLTVLLNLQKEGLNVKIVDDNQVAQTMAENGLYVYKLMPKV